VSVLQIFDAKTMLPTPLATVHLPVRVPSGFHGLFVPQEQLDSQDSTISAPNWPMLSSALKKPEKVGSAIQGKEE
jgi:hypothetical protein